MKRFPPRRRQRCSNCRRADHNRRTCTFPRRVEFPEAAAPMPADAGQQVDGAVPLTLGEQADIRAVEASMARGRS